MFEFAPKRPREQYGNVWLSVQASQDHHCEPAVDQLPLDQYESVEVALILEGRGLVSPTMVGLPEFQYLFEVNASPVAGFVPHNVVNQIREALQIRAFKAHQEKEINPAPLDIN